MRILITGGCGFIGSNLLEFHMARGDEVSVVDDLSAGTQENISGFIHHPNFYFSKSDILTWPELDKWVSWSNRIYHLAAIVGIYRVLAEPVNVIRTNVLGCERLLNAVATTQSRPQVIIASSSSVYGPNENPLLSEKNPLTIKSTEHPLSAYAISKIADESLCMAYSRTYDLPLKIVRFFNVIGPKQTGRYGMVVPRFVQQACRNEPITVFGDGNQTRSFCDIRDAMSGLDILASIPSSHNEIVNIGNSYEITINDLAELVRELAKSQSLIKHIPYHEAYGLDFSDIKQRRPDLTKYFSLTGYKNKWPLEKTITDLISKFKN